VGPLVAHATQVRNSDEGVARLSTREGAWTVEVDGHTSSINAFRASSINVFVVQRCLP